MGQEIAKKQASGRGWGKGEEECECCSERKPTGFSDQCSRGQGIGIKDDPEISREGEL